MQPLIVEALEQAREAARRDGRPRYILAVLMGEWSEASALAVVDQEPSGDHVRVAPDGATVAVYVPSSD